MKRWFLDRSAWLAAWLPIWASDRIWQWTGYRLMFGARPGDYFWLKYPYRKR